MTYQGHMLVRGITGQRSDEPLHSALCLCYGFPIHRNLAVKKLPDQLFIVRHKRGTVDLVYFRRYTDGQASGVSYAYRRLNGFQLAAGDQFGKRFPLGRRASSLALARPASDNRQWAGLLCGSTTTGE